MPEIILPKTSFKVARNTFQEYVDAPAQFLRSVAASLQDENPLFLDANLRGGVGFVVAGHPNDAKHLLSGSFYRYECTAREIKKQNGKVPFIGLGAIGRGFSEVAMLIEGVHRAGGDTEAAIRQRVMRVERDDPEIGNILKQLLSWDAFIEGVHTTHLQFNFLDEHEQTQPLPEPTQFSVFPLVRRSIVRSALLEIVLDLDEFAVHVFDDAQKVVPSIATRVREAAYRFGDYADLYKLFSSFTINGIIQEFFQRGQIFPTILEEDSNTHPDPTINRALQEDPQEAERLMNEYNLAILDEIKNTNPHLDWGLDALLNPFFRMAGPEAIITLNGITNPYSSLRVGLS